MFRFTAEPYCGFATAHAEGQCRDMTHLPSKLMFIVCLLLGSQASRSTSVGIVTAKAILLHDFVLRRVALERVRWEFVDLDNDTG